MNDTRIDDAKLAGFYLRPRQGGQSGTVRLSLFFPGFFRVEGMLQYMKAFLAEEERRKRLGLPSQVPTRTTTEDDEVAATTEEEQSSDEEPLPKSAKSSIFTAINTADMARPSTVYVTPHGTSVMPPNILLMISPF